MIQPAAKPATYADLLAVPDHLVAEILYGMLYSRPRPAPRHAAAQVALGGELTGPYQRGRGGPGGWVFMSEPELHLGPHILVPDIAGWRVERLPTMPETAWVETVPDWVCEILSPATENIDRGKKLTIYGACGVAHCWLVNPTTKFLEAYELRDGKWLLIETFAEGAEVAAPPFAAVPFPLTALWPL
jgi:Uma2 family endonuclease